MLLLTVVLLLPWLPSFLAQDFSIPQQWTNTSSVVPRNDSIQRAQGVLDSLVGYYQSDTGDVKDLFNVQNANLFSAIAIHDLVSASSTNRVDLTNRFSKKMAKLNPIVNAVG
ncbi:hypothetical protein QCA50_008124 [Cerrena zonata]|uniref:Uncharacterized protein n=1 Tax=Cerrena zonata TaxID=2478898 RepID=A0AAW0G765_9APHY